MHLSRSLARSPSLRLARAVWPSFVLRARERTVLSKRRQNFGRRREVRLALLYVRYVYTHTRMSVYMYVYTCVSSRKTREASGDKVDSSFTRRPIAYYYRRARRASADERCFCVTPAASPNIFQSARSVSFLHVVLILFSQSFRRDSIRSGAISISSLLSALSLSPKRERVMRACI